MVKGKPKKMTKESKPGPVKGKEKGEADTIPIDSVPTDKKGDAEGESNQDKGVKMMGEEPIDSAGVLPDSDEMVDASPDRWSSMTARERKFNLQEFDSFLTGLSNDFQGALTDNLTTQEEGIEQFIKKKYSTMKPLDLVNEISIRTAQIKAIYKDFLTRAYEYSLNQIRQGIEGTATLASKDVNSFIQFRIDLSASKFANDVETALKHSVADSLSKGYSLNEIVDNYKRTFAEQISKRIPVIAETEMGFTLGKANDMYVVENQRLVKNGTLPPTEAIKRFEYSAIMDSKVCPLCKQLNGTVVNLGSPILQKYKPPIHYFCRCAWLPITQGEIDAEKEAGAEAGGSTALTKGAGNKPISPDALTQKVGKNLKYKTFMSEGGCDHAIS